MNIPASLVEATISGAHTMRVEARVVPAGQTGDDPDGIEIPVLGGDVLLDATADIHGTLQLETEGGKWWPSRVSDPLAPYGRWELFVRRGIDIGNETVWGAGGYFRLDELEQAEATKGPIMIAAPDRMAAIIDARFLSPRQLQAGRTVGQVVRELVEEVYPTAEVVFDDATEFATLARSVVVEESRFEALKEIVTSAGKIWHWDGQGRLQIRSAPDPDRPLWHVRAGAGGVLVEAGRRISRQGVYNAVVARGEGADLAEPVQAVAVDDGPDSPTRWAAVGDGGFGFVPRFYSSPLIYTEQQAYAAAASLLRRNLGLPYTVDYTQVPNPLLRPWDPIRVTHDDGTRELHVAQQVTVPLGAETAMQVATQEQSRVLIRRL